MSSRIKAFLFHLLASVLIVGTVVSLIAFIWYPGPYFPLNHTPRIVAMLVMVDVILGPSMTLLVFKPTKSKRELTLDIGVILVVQFSALVYGIHSTYSVRPLFNAFYFDQFMVSTADDIDESKLPADMAVSVFRGPQLVAVRPPKDTAESIKMWGEFKAGKAPDLFHRVERYEPLKDELASVLAKGRAPDAFKQRDPSKSQVIDAFLRRCKEPAADLLIYDVTYTGGRLLVLNRKSGELLKFIDYPPPDIHSFPATSFQHQPAPEK